MELSFKVNNFRSLLLGLLIISMCLIVITPANAATDIVTAVSATPTGTPVSAVDIDYTLAGTATKVAIVVQTKTGRTVRTYSETNAGSGSVTWDLRDSNGSIVGDGDYKIKVTATPSNTTTYKSNAKISGDFSIQNNNPTIGSVTNSSKPFVPTGKNYYSISMSKLSEAADVKLELFTDSGRTDLFKTYTVSVTSGAYTFKWDGKDGSGNTVSDATYYFTVTATDKDSSPNSVTKDGQFDIDVTGPTVTGGTYTLDATSLTIPYDLSENCKTVDVNIINSVDRIVYAFKYTSSAAQAQSGSQSVVWDLKLPAKKKGVLGENIPDGEYTYSIKATDFVGSNDVYYSDTFIVDSSPVAITDVVYSTKYFKAKGNNSFPIKFTLSEPATVTVKVYDGSTLIRTLVDDEMDEGKQVLAWYGKDSAGKWATDSKKYSLEFSAVDGSGNVVTLSYPEVIKVNNVQPVINEATFYADGSFIYGISKPSFVSVKIFNVLTGKQVVTLNSSKTAYTSTGTLTWSSIVAGKYKYEVVATDVGGIKSKTVRGVTATQLTTPDAPTFAANTATWSAVANTNNGYRANLYKDEETVALATYNGPSNVTSYDFTSYMSDAGSYIVKVIALGKGLYGTSEESAASNAIVITAPTFSSSNAVYATVYKVKVVFDKAMELPSLATAAANFTVKVNGVTKTVDNVALATTSVANDTLVLSLEFEASQINKGDAVSVIYTAGVSGNMYAADGAKLETFVPQSVSTTNLP